jgi:O-antigen/teichoic acid export membrane protein
MNGISENAAVTFSAELLSFVFGLAASILLARVLGPSGRGTFALLMLIPTMMLRFGCLGIEAANVYFTGSKKYHLKDIVSNSMLSSALLGSVLLVLLALVSRCETFSHFLQSNKIVSIYLWMMALTVPVSLVCSFLKKVLLGSGRIIAFNQLNVAQILFYLVAVILFLPVLKKGLWGVVLAYAFSVLAAGAMTVLFVRKLTKISFAFKRKLFVDAARYGLKAYIANLAQFLNYRLDMFLVAFFLTPEQVGYYSLSVVLAEKLWMFPTAVSTVLFPRISAMNDTEANGLTPRVARHIFFMMFILAMLCAALGRPAIKILYGSAFLPAVVPLLLLLPGVVALGGTEVLTSDLAGRGKPQFATYAAVTSLLVNIPLNLVLIPRWGISGAAFASTAAYLVATLIVMVSFRAVSGQRFVDIILLKKQDLRDYRALLIGCGARLMSRKDRNPPIAVGA